MYFLNRSFLALSHFLFLLAGVKAWTKKYYLFSSLLFGMVVISLLNHELEEIYHYNDNTAIEWFEKSFSFSLIVGAIIQFHNYFDLQIVTLFILSLLAFFIGRFVYSSSHRTYIVSHSLWHLGSGYALLRLIEKLPKNTFIF